jgi:hypothetical protein
MERNKKPCRVLISHDNRCVKGKTVMTKQDLAKELDNMYSNALKGGSTTMIRLFG